MWMILEVRFQYKSINIEDSCNPHDFMKSTFQYNSLEYSDDSEEVFEKEDFDDFDRTVSKYLDELETHSPKSQHTPVLEYPWSSNPKLDLDEFR